MAGNKILDFGCVKGFLVGQLRAAGFESYGIDISAYAINKEPSAVRLYLHVADLNKYKILLESTQ